MHPTLDKGQSVPPLLVLVLQDSYLPSSTWLLVSSVVGAMPGLTTSNAQPAGFSCIPTLEIIDSQIFPVQILTIR
jgi:hypothetical protein